VTTPLRFGILGTGNIARQFAASFSSSQRCALAAVGSRTIAAANTFATNHGVPFAVGSYDQLVRRNDIDAVYVSLPNSMHHEWAIKALQAGKHVLCEKPLAANADQAAEMFDAAQRSGCVLAEAFMYRSHPLIHAVMGAIDAGKIGRVRLIRTSFCFRVWKTENNIRFDAKLAGGALMDIGCYCVNFSRFIAGAEPTQLHVVGQMHASGVDESAAGIMQFPGDITASFTCGMNAQADNSAAICGTEGYIEIPVPWKPPVSGATWGVAYSTPPRMDHTGGPPPAARPKETFSIDAGRALYALEADDFAEAVQGGKPLRISRDDTIGNMRVLDALRRQIGLGF
jgi:predicted dehydrogenase